MQEKEIQKALDGKRNLFITGQAGTGKSYLLKKYIETHPNTVVCASTGIAAVNIGGTTIHRAFGIPMDCVGKRITKKQDAAVRILALADTVIVDEISMCRNDVFSFMIRVLKKAEKKKGARIRLIVSGDFSQLPPVVSKADEKKLRKNSLDISGYPFTCKEWESCHFKVLELTDVHRQSDQEFVKYLNYIRAGSLRGIKYFQQFVIDDANFVPDVGVPSSILKDIQDGKSIYICGTNAEVDKLNNYCVNEIRTIPIAYSAESSGHISKDSTPMDSIIMLKEGEQVIFTVNDVINDEYQNGTLGRIQECHSSSVKVLLENGKEINVGKHTWQLYTYKGTGGKLTRSVCGIFKQIPLKPAYAITIHKSQGKTFDNVIVSPKVFAPGQLYVALSRVRSAKGLKLTSPILPEYLISNTKTDKFIKNGYVWNTHSQSKRLVKNETVKKRVKRAKVPKRSVTKERKTRQRKKV